MAIFEFDRFNETKLKALIFPFLFFSCYLWAQSIDSVRVGTAGGFSGQATSYLIHHHKINKTVGFSGTPPTVSPFEKLSYKQFHTVKKGAKSIWPEIKSFEQPSNLSKWIEIYSKGESRKYTWGDPSSPPPALLTNYYQSLMDIVKTIPFH
jgi:hypothetical protein